MGQQRLNAIRVPETVDCATVRRASWVHEPLASMGVALRSTPNPYNKGLYTVHDDCVYGDPFSYVRTHLEGFLRHCRASEVHST